VTPAYDIIIIGGSATGLWLANRLRREGYNLIVIESGTLGSEDALLSQGLLGGAGAEMHERWEACFGGWGDIDLTSVSFIAETQTFWPATPDVPGIAVKAAAKAVSIEAEQKKDKTCIAPERTPDTRSLIAALTRNLQDRIFRGEAQELLPDGQIAVSGLALQAQLIIFAAGAGNKQALEMMRVKQAPVKHRPLRQIMVRPLVENLCGHAVDADLGSRVTVTSHEIKKGEYVWYLGGTLAERAAEMGEDEALQFAKAEMQALFPRIDWNDKDWAAQDYAAPLEAKGDIHRRGHILMAWPVSLALTPKLADRILAWMQDKDIQPASRTPPPDLPPLQAGMYPWERAVWKRLV